MIRSPVRLRSACFAALALGTGWILANEAVDWRGKLVDSNWSSAKTTLEMGVTGAFAYVLTRTGLVHGGLDLSAWHGFQEVQYQEELSPREIRFEFQLDPEAELSFLHDIREGNHLGIRLSRTPLHPDIAFAESPEGEFKARASLSDPQLRPGWNSFSAVFDSGTVSYVVNERPYYSTSSGSPLPQRFGFRGGANRALVRNVELTLRDSSVLKLTFRDEGHWFLLFLACALLSVALSWAGAAFASRRLKVGVSPLYLVFILFFVSASVHALDYFWLAQRYPKDIHFLDYHSRVEPEQGVRRRILTDFGASRKKTFRVLFIGSSQTWGAGAARTNETFVRRLEEMLRVHAGPGLSIECINGGISGAHAIGLAKIYEDEWLRVHPDAVIINLSFNDTDPSAFLPGLTALVAVSERARIPTALVLEPNAPELTATHLARNHEIMRETGAAHGFPVIDLHGELRRKADVGHLWWDVVHMTSFGQGLTARYLYTELSPWLYRLRRARDLRTTRETSAAIVSWPSSTKWAGS